MTENFVSGEQLRLMPTRVKYAEETGATEDLRRIVWNICEKKNYKDIKLLIVGAGGSYPTALFARQALLDKVRSSNIDVATPQTAVQMLNQLSNEGDIYWLPYDIVIGISYSGKTPDIRRVYEICKGQSINFILVTKAEKKDVEELYEYSKDYIVSYFNPNDDTGKERGMISMASTYAPLTIFDDLKGSSISDNQALFSAAMDKVKSFGIPKIAKSLTETPIINVFYEYSTMPTAFDIESKFTESGIANVILHEKKNFSHGRYVSLYKLKAGLNINLTREISYSGITTDEEITYPRTEYDKLLKQFLKDVSMQKGTPYIEMGIANPFDSDWNMEAMSIIPYLLVEIGNAMGIDISKPLKPFPEEAKDLYNYYGII